MLERLKMTWLVILNFTKRCNSTSVTQRLYLYVNDTRDERVTSTPLLTDFFYISLSLSLISAPRRQSRFQPPRNWYSHSRFSLSPKTNVRRTFGYQKALSRGRDPGWLYTGTRTGVPLVVISMKERRCTVSSFLPIRSTPNRFLRFFDGQRTRLNELTSLKSAKSIYEFNGTNVIWSYSIPTYIIKTLIKKLHFSVDFKTVL